MVWSPSLPIFCSVFLLLFVALHHNSQAEKTKACIRKIIEHSKVMGLQLKTKHSHKAGYGLAIMTTDKLIAGKTMREHTGSAYSLYSITFFQPEEKFGIVVISNGCHPGYTDGFNTGDAENGYLLYNRFMAN